MDWELAIEKNHGALKRVLAMLVAMVGMGETGEPSPAPSRSVAPPSVLPDISPTRGEISSSPTAPIAEAEGGGPSAPLRISPHVGEMSGPSTGLRTEGGNVEHSPESSLPSTLPRHLHRFVLRLLRPAEAATRRLIIIAARGLVVKLPKPRMGKSEQRAPRSDPRAMPEWARLRLENGLPIEFPRGEPIPLWAREAPEREERKPVPRVPFFPMFDPMKRFDRKPARRRIPEDRMPRIALLNDDGWSAPFHLRRAPPPPLPPTPDDPLDATRIHRRLEMIGRALDDLPRQAQRFARWQARRDARMAARGGKYPGASTELHPPLSPPHKGERDAVTPADAQSCTDISGRANTVPHRLPPPCGEGTGVGENWAELGVTPEAIALLNRSKQPGRNAQPAITAQTPKPRRFHRTSLMRPGRPPGWRRKPNHDVYEVLNELHGLAVWASERRDSS